MWFYRRMMRISRTQKLTNNNKYRETVSKLKLRKTSYLGQLMRHPEVDVIEGKMKWMQEKVLAQEYKRMNPRKRTCSITKDR